MQSSHLICQITTYVPYLNEPWKLSNYYQWVKCKDEQKQRELQGRCLCGIISRLRWVSFLHSYSWCGNHHLWTPVCGVVVAIGELSGILVVPPEGVPEPAGEALRHGPHQLFHSALLQLHHSHIVLQLLGRHVDVPRVPQHPPDQAEEDDDGPHIDEQVVKEEPSEHPHHDDHDAEYVVGQGEPKQAHAAADPAVAPLHSHFYLYGGWASGSGHGPNRCGRQSEKAAGVLSESKCWKVRQVWAERKTWHNPLRPKYKLFQGYQPVIKRVKSS